MVRVRSLPRRGRDGHQQPRRARRRPGLPDRASSATTAKATNCARRWPQLPAVDAARHLLGRRPAHADLHQADAARSRRAAARAEPPRHQEPHADCRRPLEDLVIDGLDGRLAAGRCPDRAGSGERGGLRRGHGAGARAAGGAGRGAARASSSWPTAASGSACSATSALKPNQAECRRALCSGHEPTSQDAVRTNWPSTAGGRCSAPAASDGILLADPRPARLRRSLVPAYPVTGPIDIVGAGDSTSAGIACAVAAGATLERGGGVRQPGRVDHHSADRHHRHRVAGAGPATLGRGPPT